MSKRKSRQFRGSKCLNCETSLDISEKYCHQCGQLNSTKKLTIGDFFEEFLSNFYAYDSRLRNSIVSIFTKPGILAKEFNEGKRQKYANPFRLFLSVSIVLFISMGLDTGNNEEIKEPSTKSKEKIEQENIDEKKSDSIALHLLGTNLKITNQKRDTVALHQDSIYTKKQLNSNSNVLLRTITSYRNYNLKHPEKSSEESLIDLGFENTFLNRLIYKKATTFKSNEITDELFDYFRQNLPILIFITLPFLTLMFWLVFYSKSKNYTEHLVFTYTFYTFLFIGMLIFNLLDYFPNDISSILAGLSFTFVFPIYLYKSLRKFYQQSRWKTIFKFVLLNILFIPFAIISFLLIIFIGVLFL